MIPTGNAQSVSTWHFARSLAHISFATGVLTKPDRIGRGDHDVWVRFITNEYKPLANGWFSVKQPDSQAVAEGITWEEARSQEELFFAQVQPWSSLDVGTRQQLGTANLTERLSDILSELIVKRYVAWLDTTMAMTC